MVPGFWAKWLGRRIGSADYRRFIVPSRSRTGSNLLVSYLTSHPNIVAKSELFRRLEGRDYQAVLSEFFGARERQVLAAGFKIFYYHPLDDRESSIWEDLASMSDLIVIHLRRRNVLRTLTSRRIAEKQDAWTSRNAGGSVPLAQRRVAMDADELRDGFERTRRWEKEAAARFSHHTLVDLWYEDLVRDVDSEFGRITRALGVRPWRPRSGLERQNPESLEDLLINYSELEAVFRGTEWAGFFDE